MEKKTLTVKGKVGIASSTVIILGVVAFFVIKRIRKAHKEPAAK